MKKFILSLFLGLISLTGFSQAYQVTVSGTVLNGQTGMPLPGIQINIQTDSLSGGGYYNSVFTDINGYYSDTFNAADGEQGMLYTSMVDCDGQPITEVNQYDITNNTFEVNFTFCDNPGGGGGGGDTSCMAMYSYYFTDNMLEAHFEDESFGNPTSWDWDFGDGATSTDQNPVHLYSEAGVYEVTLNIAGDSCSSSFTDWVWVDDDSTGFDQCQAMYWAYPSDTSYMTFIFEDDSWTADWGTPDSWSWDFGDGAVSTEQNPVHTYAQEGSYEVCLTITDTANDCESTYCSEILVEAGSGCEAFYYYMPEDSMGNDMTHLHFYDFSQGNPDTWAWDFGDGNTSSEQNPTHVFAQEGIYNVCLTISNTADSCQDTYCEDIYVYNDSIGDCYGYFEYEAADSLGLTLDFTAVNYSSDSMDYSWDFGDGSTGTGETTSHTYADGGVYNVVLTAVGTSPTGCQWTYEETVWVGDNWTFTISGNVYLDSTGTSADAGSVYLMVFDTSWTNIVAIDTAEIDADGSYEFEADPFEHCVYFVQAELSDQSAYFGQYVPTYYINSLSWEEAWPVFPFFPFVSYDIFMVPQSTSNSGNAAVKGVVNAQSTRGVVDGVMMLLMDENGNPIGYVRTADDGTFDFAQLAYGTYKLRAEYVGVNSQTATITLSQDNPTATIIVTLKDGEAYLGIDEIHSAYLKEFGNIYPNPVTSDASVNVTMKQASKVKVAVTNQIGQVVVSESVSLKPGVNTVDLHTTNLPQGVYIVKVLTKDGALATRKMVKVY